MQGADHYELWVSRRDGSGVVINLTNISVADYTPPSNLAPADYRVWVRAVSSAGVFSSWSTPVDFTVTVLDSPRHFLNSGDSPLTPVLAVFPAEKGHTDIEKSRQIQWVASLQTPRAPGKTLSGWQSIPDIQPQPTAGAVRLSGDATVNGFVPRVQAKDST